jgi:hypothetical protein
MGLKKASLILLLVAAMVGIGVIAMLYRSALLGGMGTSNPCLSEKWEDIRNLSGLRFEVEYTNCDTLAKEEAVSVYVTEAQEGAGAPGSLDRGTLVFRYDPSGIHNPPPKIQATGNHRILISVPEVSSVTVQRRKWRDVAIDYNIEKNMNP